MRSSKVLILSLSLLAASGARAQMPSFANVGRTPTQEEIQKLDISVGPDGKGLPAGQGTSKEGASLFALKCARCHGASGEGGAIGPRLITVETDRASLTTVHPTRIIGSYWPYATTIWDYINRAMPRNQGGSLSPNEVYGLTAFILTKSGIIHDDEVMNATTLPRVRMPNRNGFVPQDFSEIPDIHKRGCYQGLCP